MTPFFSVYLGVFTYIVGAVGNLILSSNRAHRVLLETGVWVLEHDCRRIGHGYTHKTLGKYSCMGVFGRILWAIGI